MQQYIQQTIDEYINKYPKELQVKLDQLRALIKKNAPKVDEAIKYAIPIFVYHGNMIGFAVFKNHNGLYPAPVDHENFKGEFNKYKTSERGVQFPLDKPSPITLITKIVKHRVKSVELKNLKSKDKK